MAKAVEIIDKDTQRPPVETPWGVAETVLKITEGIYQVSTPSHGGLWLTPDKLAQMPQYLVEATFRPEHGPQGWFEEDADWAYVALAFPRQFPAPASQEHARNSITYFHPELLKRFDAERQEAGS